MALRLHLIKAWRDRLVAVGRHTGKTDLPLTAEGRRRLARTIGPDAACRFRRDVQDSYLTEEDVALMARAGFNSIWLPINWCSFVTDQNCLVCDGQGWRHLDRLLGWARRYGLKVRPPRRAGRAVELADRRHHARPQGILGKPQPPSRRALLYAVTAASCCVADEIVGTIRDCRQLNPTSEGSRFVLSGMEFQGRLVFRV